MRKPSASFLSRSALLCATLTLGSGCESTKPRAAGPTDGVPVTQGGTSGSTTDTPTGTAAPEAPASTKGTSAWHRARVGDQVVYSFSAIRTPPRDAQGGSAAAGQLTLEVAAVESSRVWLTLTLQSDKGGELTQPRLSRRLAIPMRVEASRPLEVAREGTATSEQPTAAGRTWEAKRYLRDNRPVDGPLENRLYAVDAGPLYLTNGLLDASTTLSGFGGAGSHQLTLVSMRQGKEGAGMAPDLEWPLGPGTWFDREMESEGTKTVLRTCQSAEAGYVLRTEAPVNPATDEAPCQDFSQASVMPLEEVLLSFISLGLEPKQWPPAVPNSAPAVRETLAVGTKRVPVLQVDANEGPTNAKQVRTLLFAADPWEKTLGGLAHEARFEPLSDFTYRVSSKGKRESQGGAKLTGFGAWQP
ncbi:DUF6068 family protein [Myxococcus faecalis]|uniref:DUF6068 family protein n=1 Tax=Myxococcus TaxID=32 RepID=UPI001CBF5C8D|nr:DUF6068 family protein [Myxococcus sp. XM-1-1-1]MBZ4411314.1 DUF6068 family protein [Myxococcus sp. XM-1-1-1]